MSYGEINLRQQARVMDCCLMSQKRPLNLKTHSHVHISVLNDALWDIEQLHFGICGLGQSMCDAKVDGHTNLGFF